MEPETPVKTWGSQCSNCGATISETDSPYCPNCGQPWKIKQKRANWWDSWWFIALLIFGVCGACTAPFVAAGVLWYRVPESRFYINIALGVLIAWYVFGIILKRIKR